MPLFIYYKNRQYLAKETGGWCRSAHLVSRVGYFGADGLACRLCIILPTLISLGLRDRYFL